MIDLDVATVSVMTAVVVITAGIVFIVETLIRVDDAVGRIWSIAFLSGILASVAYAVWAFAPETWGAVAVGNAAFVASAGFMWLGCRRFSERRVGWAEVAVLALTFATALAVILRGADGGGWAGAEVMFLGLFAFPAAATVEIVRGSVAGIRTSWALAVIFGIQSLYYLVRFFVLLIAGPDSEVFTLWWGTIPTSILTIVLTLVVVVVASVLRAERAGLRGRRRLAAPGLTFSGVLEPRWFERFVTDAVERGASRGETVAVISMRIDDLATVTTAFGASESESLRTAWHDAVRRHAPAQAWIGDDGSGGIAVSSVVVSDAEARLLAATLRRAVYEELNAVEASVIPLVGVGIALSDATGGVDDGASLIDAARGAAGEATFSEDTSIVIAR